ncbi:YceI family protein [Catellatospora tritici]|uniref:YceI family protein n=1 Tax=Catellatospora tritici TaxID=2851566 RepID=UPI001C2CF60A|nr:YceI family protein [Catellatospora tritici]MBV1855601.1 YceI family protein [Catellatospora tritici]
MSSASLALADLKPGVWVIDPVYSEIGFTIRHLMTKIRGVFTEFSGAITVAAPLADSTVTAEIQVASLDTHSTTRDNHVISGEILDTANFPRIRFAGTGIDLHGASGTLHGELTVKDVTSPVTLEVEFNGVSPDPWGGTRAGFSATTTITRRQFGVEWEIPLQGDRALLGDKIDITIEVQCVYRP